MSDKKYKALILKMGSESKRRAEVTALDEDKDGDHEFHIWDLYKVDEYFVLCHAASKIPTKIFCSAAKVGEFMRGRCEKFITE